LSHLLHFVVGFALLLHVLFWGAGLARLVMPRPWRRFWPVLVVPAGLALQSAVVWFGVHAGWRGTQSYAWPSEILPAALLLIALWRHGLRPSMTDVSRFGLVWLQMAGCLVLLTLPLAIASKGLTTIALSSCDAADYAGGARAFLEFARHDRTGFLGLTEVVQGGSTLSTDNFIDFWLRLNHFTPAALIAFNGAVLDCAPHELTGLFTLMLVPGTLPVVFWVARAILGYSGGVSLIVALLYGLSPVTWYAAMQVAPGQLLAAHAIALLTWVGVAMWRRRLTWRSGLQFAGVLTVTYWLLLGSYNFILLVALVPALTFAGGLALWRADWARLGAWAVAMLAPLLVCAAIFFTRAAGLAERVALFREFDFGWRIAPLTPEGWLGMVSGPEMEPWNFLGLRWALMALVGVPFLWALWRALDQRRTAAWLVISLMAPVLAGYIFLEVRGTRLGTNASYDAYKLFAVFQPLLLAAACWWVTLRRSRRLTEWFGVVGLAGVIVAFNVLAMGMTIWRMARPPLIVDGPLRDVRKIEAMPEVTSVNVLLDHMWERLWANAFLLRKPQYFATTTYEARWATPLKGEWDLRGGLITVRSRDANANVSVNPYYRLVRRTAASVTADFGDGWHAEETVPGARERWRWSKSTGAEISVDNPLQRPLRVVVVLDSRSYGPRRIDARVKGERAAPDDGANVTAERAKVRLAPIVVPPGKHFLELEVGPTSVPAPPDPRGLGICIWGVELEVLAD
jgi:hypothetical protein